MVKNLPAKQKMQVQPLGWQEPLEKEMATYSSIPAWRILWTEEPEEYSPWGHKESNTEVTCLPHRANSDMNDCRFLWKLWRSEIVNDIFKVSKELSTHNSIAGKSIFQELKQNKHIIWCLVMDREAGVL